MRRIIPVATVLIAFAASEASARVIYVDNKRGDDINDGTAPEISGLQVGPVRTFRRAQVLLGPGDVIEIANTGEPYYDELKLIGGRTSGTPSHPTVVNGNGAVLDGSDAVDPEAWESLGSGLWRLEPLHKGWFQLIRDQEPVPEVPAEFNAARPTPPPGHWAAWRGAIYYRGLPDELPAFEPFRVATRNAGIFLYGTKNIIVRGLMVRHYRLDGVNAHDQVRRVALDEVISTQNGRSGFFAGGSSDIIIRGGATQANREASLLLKEKAQVDVQDVSLDAEPVVE